MNYNQYNTEDFITDEEFKSWVLFPTDESDQFWKKWISSNPHKRELVSEAREIILSMRFNDVQPNADVYESVLSNVLSADHAQYVGGDDKDKSESSPKPKGISNNMFMLKVASTVVVFIISGLLVFYLNQPTPSVQPEIRYITKKIDVGQRTIELPDGSYVKLNSKSSITYPEQFSDTLRRVNLMGEAYFDVEKNKDKPFIVNTPYLDVNVLGTSFNVRSYNEEDKINVALASGKVLINSITDKGIGYQDENFYLLPGEKCVFDRKTNALSKTSFDAETEYGWKDGILLFKDADLDEFIATLEKWYGVKFNVVGLKKGDWHIEGRFENESLREVLEGLSFTYNIKYNLDSDNNMVTLFI